MNAILALALVLVVMMFIVGGKQGLANFFALAANALLMILVVILMASGFNPIIVAVIFGLIILAATIFLSTNQLNVDHDVTGRFDFGGYDLKSNSRFRAGRFREP